MPDLNISDALRSMSVDRPLVHHITNWVTIGHCADITRRWGCLPVMAHATHEVDEMTGHASALVLNIGTLSQPIVDAMEVAAQAANRKGIPVVLDAVGAGATRYRTEQTQRLLRSVKIDILKGNAGEISTLAGAQAEVRGVESIMAASDMEHVAKKLASQLDNVVVVTAKRDIVTDGSRVLHISQGAPLMGEVVGTGCTSTSTVGCFAAVEPDLLTASAMALAAFGLAGERATLAVRGPGDFYACLMNAIEEMVRCPDPLILSVDEYPR
jgi:hydroxyethylthiazole kinase